MTVQRKLHLLAVLPIVTVALILLLLGIQVSRLRTIEQGIGQAEALENEIVGLNLITERYLFYRLNALNERWNAKQKKVAALAEQLEGENQEEADLLSGIRKNAKDLRRNLDHLAGLEREKRNGQPLFDEWEELEAEIGNAVSVQSRDMYSKAHRLRRLVQQETADIRRQTVITSLVLLVILAALAYSVSRKVQNAVQRGIDRLLDGTRCLAAGRLDCRIDIGGDSEFALVANSLNYMAEQVMHSNEQLREINAKLTAKSEELVQSNAKLRALNNELDERVKQRTEDLQKANELMNAMRQHAEKLAARATIEGQRHRDLAMRTKRMIKRSTQILCRQSAQDILDNAMMLARELTGARYAITGHYYRGSVFIAGTTSKASDTTPCPEGRIFTVEKGGVYLDILQGNTLRMTQQQLEQHPAWWGVPEGHAKLRGLLGVPVLDDEGKPQGLLMVSDKEGGEDFTEEDEILLAELGYLVGYAMAVAKGEDSSIEA